MKKLDLLFRVAYFLSLGCQPFDANLGARHCSLPTWPGEFCLEIKQKKNSITFF